MKKVCELYDKGITLKKIGKIMNVNGTTIGRRLKKTNYAMRKYGWHLPERQKSLIIREKISKTRKRLFNMGLLDLSGNKNPAFIDGMYCFKKMSRKGWFKVRKEVLERDNYNCVKCNKNKEDIRLDIHHIIPYRVCKEHKIDNCITLCFKCHARLHGNKHLIRVSI